MTDKVLVSSVNEFIHITIPMNVHYTIRGIVTQLILVTLFYGAQSLEILKDSSVMEMLFSSIHIRSVRCSSRV